MKRLTAKAVGRVLDYQRAAARDPTKLGSEVQRGEEGITAQRAARSQDAPRLGTLTAASNVL